jgi:hypothetical protein
MARALANAGRGPTRSLLVLAGVAVLASCSGNGGPLASASWIERAFVSAEATWDLNHDGNVTCGEWKQYASRLFREADANRDGLLSREEFAALGRVDRLFDTVGFDYFDSDGDGRISMSELVDKPNPAFALLDKNGDCIISPDERLHLHDDNVGTGGSKKGKRRGGM